MTQLLTNPLYGKDIAAVVGTWTISSAIGYSELLKTAGAETAKVLLEFVFPEIEREYGGKNKQTGIIPVSLQIFYRIATADLTSAVTLSALNREWDDQNSVTPKVQAIGKSAPTLPHAQGVYAPIIPIYGANSDSPFIKSGDAIVAEFSFVAPSTSVIGIHKALLTYRECDCC